MFYSYHNLQGYYSNSFQFLNFYHCIKHLHSTMVLFKLEASYGGIVCKKFTFHYGPIQIVKKNTFFLFTKKFTFHYGPIQI